MARRAQKQAARAKRRLRAIRVNEMSLVDRAANKRKWILVKRDGDDMSKKTDAKKNDDGTQAGGTDGGGAGGASGGSSETPPAGDPPVTPPAGEGGEGGEPKAVGEGTPAGGEPAKAEGQEATSQADGAATPTGEGDAVAKSVAKAVGAEVRAVLDEFLGKLQAAKVEKAAGEAGAELEAIKKAAAEKDAKIVELEETVKKQAAALTGKRLDAVANGIADEGAPPAKPRAEKVNWGRGDFNEVVNADAAKDRR